MYTNNNLQFIKKLHVNITSHHGIDFITSILLSKFSNAFDNIYNYTLCEIYYFVINITLNNRKFNFCISVTFENIVLLILAT